MTTLDRERRTFLQLGGVALVLGVAGCVEEEGRTDDDDTTSDDENDTTTAGTPDEDDGGDTTVDSDEDDDDAAGDTDDESDETDDEDEDDDLDAFLADARGYEGTIEDFTDRDEVSVIVGPEREVEFSPPAIRITEGTTVAWEWDSDGHSVTHVDDEFDSEILDEGDIFEHIFEETGEYRYICVPHEGMGHLGVVIVE